MKFRDKIPPPSGRNQDRSLPFHRINEREAVLFFAQAHSFFLTKINFCDILFHDAMGNLLKYIAQFRNNQ
jgi:hypothetical protein